MSAVDGMVQELLDGAKGAAGTPVPATAGSQTDPRDFLMGSATAATFDAPAPVTYRGLVTGKPRIEQQRAFGTNEPMFWDDGKPKEHLVVTIRTLGEDAAWRDEPIEGDDGERTLYVKFNTQKAIKAALRRAGASMLEDGAYLELTYTKNAPKQKGSTKLPAKLYEAVYARPGSEKAAAYETELATKWGASEED